MNNWNLLRTNIRRLTSEQESRIEEEHRLIRADLTLEQDIQELKEQTKDKYEDRIVRQRDWLWGDF